MWLTLAALPLIYSILLDLSLDSEEAHKDAAVGGFTGAWSLVAELAAVTSCTSLLGLGHGCRDGTPPKQEAFRTSPTARP